MAAKVSSVIAVMIAQIQAWLLRRPAEAPRDT
jgi:hypothetical protein